jgi:hypothetical protein
MKLNSDFLTIFINSQKGTWWSDECSTGRYWDSLVGARHCSIHSCCCFWLLLSALILSSGWSVLKKELSHKPRREMHATWVGPWSGISNVFGWTCHIATEDTADGDLVTRVSNSSRRKTTYRRRKPALSNEIRTRLPHFNITWKLGRLGLGSTYLTWPFYHGKEPVTVSTVMFTFLTTFHDTGQNSPTRPKEDAAKAGPKPSKYIINQSYIFNPRQTACVKEVRGFYLARRPIRNSILVTSSVWQYGQWIDVG